MPNDSLRESRLRYRDEVIEVLRCRGAKGKKRRLYERWLASYSPEMVSELVAVARDKAAMKKISEWSL